MTVTLLPDVEELLVNFFLDQTELHDLDDEHDELLVCSTLPKTKVWPALRVTRFGGLPVTNRPLRLDAATVQIEAFGGPKKLAWRIAETARALMAERLPGSHDEGAVTAVTFGALADVPDITVADPAKERWLFTATVYVHSLPSGS